VGGKKYQVEVIAYDDQYKAAEAIAAYNRLVTNDGVRHLVLLGSPQTVALKQHIEDDKILTMTTAATPKALDANSKFLFRAINTPGQFVPPFTKWLKENLKERRVAILNPNDETGWDQTKTAEKNFKENGFDVVSSETFERTTTDFQPILTKILATKPDILELSGIAPATTGLVVRQARELGFKGKFTKNSGPSPKEIVDAAGKEASEGMLMLFYADPGTPGYKHLVTEYRKAIGQDPNQLIVTFYDAANIILQAVKKAGTSNDPEKENAAVHQVLPMNSIQGDKLQLGGKELYGVDQQVMTVGYVAIMKNGEPVVVGKF
jgi:branched-chain amino acid transport system substrate-binding protein